MAQQLEFRNNVSFILRWAMMTRLTSTKPVYSKMPAENASRTPDTAFFVAPLSL